MKTSISSEICRSPSSGRALTCDSLLHTVVDRASSSLVLHAVPSSSFNRISVSPIQNSSGHSVEDEAIRQGIKDYANWPTIPQLYVNGEFVGGSDIVMEMYQSGELQQALGAKS